MPIRCTAASRTCSACARDITARKRRRGRARAARGAAAPGAEDGGDRPPHRRHRARLQQHPARASWATWCSPQERTEAAGRRQARRASSSRRAVSARRARDLIQQMLTFSRGQRGAPRAAGPARSSWREAVEAAAPGRCPSTARDCAPISPPDARVLARPGAARAGAAQPAHQRARRHGRQRAPRDRGARRAAALRAVCVELPPALLGRLRRARGARHRPRHRRRTCSSACSSRSSPPRKSARAAAWASPRCTASCTSTAGTSWSDRTPDGGSRASASLLPALDEARRSRLPRRRANAARKARAARRPRAGGRRRGHRSPTSWASCCRAGASTRWRRTDPRQALYAFTAAPERYDLVHHRPDHAAHHRPRARARAPRASAPTCR